MPSRKFVACSIGSISFTVFVFLAFGILIIIPRFQASGYIPKVHDAIVLSKEHLAFLISAEILYIILHLIVYMRYLEIKEYFMMNQEGFTVLLINKVSFAVGFILLVSFKIFTQFKFNDEYVKFKEPANIAISIAFMLYCTLQTILSCKMAPRMIGFITLFLRMLIALLHVAVIAVNLISPLTENVYILFKSLELKPDMKYEDFKSNCYAGSEWLIIISSWLYIITYVSDFDKMAISPPKIYINCVTHLEYLKNTLKF